jgi:hypothetical protein
MIDDHRRSCTPLAWICRALQVLYPEQNTILLFFSLNNHTRVRFARVLTCMSSTSIPSSSPLTLPESCSCFPSLPFLSPYLQVKCDIHAPDSTTPLSMEWLLFGTAMTSSDILSGSLPRQLVYETSVLADKFPRGRDVHYNCRPACPDINPVISRFPMR